MFANKPVPALRARFAGLVILRDHSGEAVHAARRWEREERRFITHDRTAGEQAVCGIVNGG